MTRRLPIPLLLTLVFLMAAACNVHDEDRDIPPVDDDSAEPDNGDDDDSSCRDDDGDGWCVPEDCRDQDRSVHPGAVEECRDAVDNDCNGFTDRDDPACPAPPDDDQAALPEKIRNVTATCQGRRHVLMRRAFLLERSPRWLASAKYAENGGRSA
ncbi:MAG: putative metal-binding motif-containing protein [Deltaproteobacteria bacterium]|nr:putative metal-binding motif-containing protein [Deltaproteobacteria bacterium]